MRSRVELRARPRPESLEIKEIPCRRALSLSLSLSFSDASETDIKRCPALPRPTPLIQFFAQSGLVLGRAALS